MSFDLSTIYNEKRPLSWSAISLFKWNAGMWYDKYVEKIYPPETPELRFGSMIDKRIQDDPKFLPHLVRYPILQHEMRVTWDGIPLLGFADAYQPCSFCEANEDHGECEKRALRDYKTGRKAWDQKRADETGQLTMYLLMEYLKDRKIKAEEFELYIDWLPTHYKDNEICFIEENHKKLIPTTFKTKRTMQQVLKFGQLIHETWKTMQKYGESANQKLVVASKDEW